MGVTRNACYFEYNRAPQPPQLSINANGKAVKIVNETVGGAALKYVEEWFYEIVIRFCLRGISVTRHPASRLYTAQQPYIARVQLRVLRALTLKTTITSLNHLNECKATCPTLMKSKLFWHLRHAIASGVKKHDLGFEFWDVAIGSLK